MNDTLHPLHQLMGTIQDRVRNRPAGSYTTRLLDGGPPKIAAKIREESEEFIEAGSTNPINHAHLVAEAADLIYHLMVMLGYHEINWADVEIELARRFGISGLEEKANRQKKD